MTEPEPELEVMSPSPVDPSEAPRRLLWSAPRLARFGSVSDMTQGISYTPTDGISNLTP